MHRLASKEPQYLNDTGDLVRFGPASTPKKSLLPCLDKSDFLCIKAEGEAIALEKLQEF
ncbi:hypothetical protein CKA32_001901 [Geitlerinema sp. FC II]|nr:hypothetical protein CKA32_001901 [Geitlerinema sp. FC II]